MNFRKSIFAGMVGLRWITTFGVCTAILILSIVGCATPGSPSGGPKDTDPPQVVEDESSPNPTVNFNEDKIVLTFNEWVKLNDPANQIIISPPIDPRPIPKLSGKALVIPIEPESLKDSTTYIINMGNAIQDITERNSPSNLSYVFSTGSFVDSLEMKGAVVDALTGEAVADVKVLLHTTSSDTAITNDLPAYFASTDTSGSFDLGYLRADTFWVYAIKEEGYGDFKLNAGESVGFLPNPVILTDTVVPQVTLTLFRTEVPIAVITVDRSSPVQKVVLVRQSSRIDVGDTYPKDQYWQSNADTISFWYQGDDTIQVELLENELPFDTIRLTPRVGEGRAPRLQVLKSRRHPDKAIEVLASDPILSMDLSLITIRVGDSAVVPSFDLVIDSTDRRKLTLSSAWTSKTNYTVEALPGAIVSDFGQVNDSIKFAFAIDDPDAFGLLNLTVSGLDSTVNYVVRLIDGATIVEEFEVQGKRDETFTLANIESKEYSVSIIEDANGNGDWDTGDVELKRLPERIFTQIVEGLRPGWDLDFTINWPDE